jgi:DNA mismatch repair protein MutS2
VVPVDLHLGDRFDVMVITGPNTGGKTVTLKTVGLLSLMAAAGLHLPAAQGTRVPYFRRVLADIGDEQDLAQSLSTFSSHVKRISRILDEADAHSLVLMDELGTGTDPLEGEALGRAILKYLVRSRARVLVSTHLSKLKEFAFSSDRVENACVEFDPDTLKPTFRLSIGMPGESNALRIARRLGIPDAVVRDAESVLETGDSELKSLMDEVQRIRIQSEKALGKTRRDQETAHRIREKTEAHEKEIAFKRSVLEEEAEREIDECLRRSREEAMALIPKLQNLPAPYGEHVEALKEVLDRIVEHSPLGRKRRRFVDSLKKGDMVYLPRYREKCQVLKIYKKEDCVEVAYRGLSMKVPAQEIMWPHWF